MNPEETVTMGADGEGNAGDADEAGVALADAATGMMAEAVAAGADVEADAEARASAGWVATAVAESAG